MSTQRQELARREFNFVPTSLKEAQEYAGIIANSGICPEGFRGRPNDVLIVLQLGSELGLKPMQALRSLGSINGMPFAYGDGLLALVKRHTQFEDMKEWFEGDLNTKTLTACCTMIRKGKEPVTQKFSIEDAIRAGLWTKGGVWSKYPRRMLQHRARGYAARDAFPDALYGLMSEEEALSVAQAEVVEVKVQGKGMAGLEQSLGLKEAEPVEVTVIEAEPVETDKTDETYQPTKLEQFKELITRQEVSKGAITVTLKKFGLASIDDLSDEQIDTWTTHINNRRKK